MYFSELQNSNKFLMNPTTKDWDSGETDRARDRGEPHKIITMPPASSYLTDRQYSVRRPLFSGQLYTSILKKNQTEREKVLEVPRKEENQRSTYMSSLTGAELIIKSFSPSYSDVSASSASREDDRSRLAVSELSPHEALSSESPLHANASARWSMSSSILEVQRLNPPLRSPLTSPVPCPSYTPCSGYRTTQTGGRGENIRVSSGRPSKGSPVSVHQANYWACAIPKSSPPSADRQSSDWDPNKEYQALLDYTYPLRPGQVATELDSSNIGRDLNLQDSGIELDNLCSSTSLSGLSYSVTETEQTKDGSALSRVYKSPVPQTFTETSDGLRSRTRISQTDSVGLSLDSLHSRVNKKDSHCLQHNSLSSCPALVHSNSVHSQWRCVCAEVDEEFWPLPVQLEELQLLSRQVREVTAQQSQPVSAGWEPDTTSILSSSTLSEKQEKSTTEINNPLKDEGNSKTHRKKTRHPHGADHRNSKDLRRRSEEWVEPVGGELSKSGLWDMESFVEQLYGLKLPISQMSSSENQQQSDSLIQHIQMFCSHLEQLIQQLYAVSEKMELLATPTANIDDMKSSLAECQRLQREVCHHPLTTSVLHTGQLLLSCINATSPFLRDALVLIEKQSGALRAHTEHVYSSILCAVDSLTQHCGGEEPGLVRVNGTTM